jgi:hypothetical protein
MDLEQENLGELEARAKHHVKVVSPHGMPQRACRHSLCTPGSLASRHSHRTPTTHPAVQLRDKAKRALLKRQFRVAKALLDEALELHPGSYKASPARGAAHELRRWQQLLADSLPQPGGHS